VAAGLMEDDAAELIVDDDGHLPSGAQVGIDHGYCRPGGLPGVLLNVDGVVELEAHGGPRAVETNLLLAALGGDGLDHCASANPPVLNIEALRVGNEDLLILIHVVDPDLTDLLIIVLSGQVGPGHEVNLLLFRDGFGQDLDGMAILNLNSTEVDDDVLACPRQGRRRCLGHLDQAITGVQIGVGVDIVQFAEDADPDAVVTARYRLLQVSTNHL